MGADTLTGGAGNDTFLYTAAAQSAGTSVDHITDFDAGDHIDLGQIDADTTQAGDQAFSFIGANAFDHQAGELRAAFDAVNNVWTIEGDTDGDGQADFTLMVATVNGHQIVSGDFIA
jgi:Ca2+-binding RTX toxin-like protein